MNDNISDRISSGDSKTVFVTSTECSPYFWGANFTPILDDDFTSAPLLAVQVDLMGNIIPSPPGPEKE